ncbi:MAG: exodeoxyribonuclease VII small subunit [Chlamydiota bacterium]|nr:exodeoxyribonuclease VII small subunit [Chlamydiota bacterium]
MQEDTHTPSFEEAYKQLEEILTALSSDTLPLSQSVEKYGEATALMKRCRHLLKEAEQTIEILTKSSQGELKLDSEGKPLTAPFPSQSS